MSRRLNSIDTRKFSVSVFRIYPSDPHFQRDASEAHSVRQVTGIREISLDL
jgi:hypothetical protein